MQQLFRIVWHITCGRDILSDIELRRTMHIVRILQRVSVMSVIFFIISAQQFV